MTCLVPEATLRSPLNSIQLDDRVINLVFPLYFRLSAANSSDSSSVGVLWCFRKNSLPCAYSLVPTEFLLEYIAL